jgi:hypothetical protein
MRLARYRDLASTHEIVQCENKRLPDLHIRYHERSHSKTDGKRRAPDKRYRAYRFTRHEVVYSERNDERYEAGEQWKHGVVAYSPDRPIDDPRDCRREEAYRCKEHQPLVNLRSVPLNDRGREKDAEKDKKTKVVPDYFG